MNEWRNHNEGRASEACRLATIAAYRGIWLALRSLFVRGAKRGDVR